jgi:hypothetical protein
VAVDIVRPRVAGIGVHKKVAWVAVRLPGDAPGERKVIIKRFKTFWQPLQKMAAWLAELGVTGAAMEAPGCTGGRSTMPWLVPGSRCACATRRICGMSRAARPT